MKRTLYVALLATAALRQLDRRFVVHIWATLDALLAEPDTVNYRNNEDDPSVFGVTVAGDITIWFEILDEQHAIRVLDIEE